MHLFPPLTCSQRLLIWQMETNFVSSHCSLESVSHFEDPLSHCRISASGFGRTNDERGFLFCGDAMASSKTMLERFWCRVTVTDGCWLWIGHKDEKGYGVFYPKETSVRSHRFSYILHSGEQIPDGMCVCHHCDVPACVNPTHLFLGTNDDNVADSTRKQRRNRPIGVKNPKVKLRVNQVYEIRRLLSAGRKCVELAKVYGVGKACIYSIRSGKSWKSLESQQV